VSKYSIPPITKIGKATQLTNTNKSTECPALPETGNRSTPISLDTAASVNKNSKGDDRIAEISTVVMLNA